MREKRTGINYEFSWNPYPKSFFSVRYYDHMENGGCGEVGSTIPMDFPTIDSNAIITHWGLSVINLDSGDYIEDPFNSFGNFRATLIINGGRVFGYSGVDFPVSTFLSPGINMSLGVGVIENLCPLSFPITQDESTVRIEFINTGITFVGEFFGRVRGIYAIAS